MSIRCCKDCLSRSAECHSTCEKYKRESEAHQQELKENRIRNEHHRHLLDGLYNQMKWEAMSRKKRDAYRRKH